MREAAIAMTPVGAAWVLSLQPAAPGGLSRNEAVQFMIRASAGAMGSGRP